MLNFQFGDIVLVAALIDPRGRNPKDRPAVVIGSRSDEASRTLVEVMAITTFIADPLPDDHFLLPWSLPFHPRTHLTKRCAAVGSWLTTIDSSQILRPIGYLPGRWQNQIATWLASHDPS